MSFYTSASFFLLAGLMVVPAAFLGLMGRGLRRWGMVASACMLACLFSQGTGQLPAFALFCVAAVLPARLLLRRPRTGAPDTGAYRLALACALAPLVIYKLTLSVPLLSPGALFAFAGISYATFRAVQIVVEIHDGLITELPLADHLYFICFFPTITSGPIDRSRRFLAEVQRPPTRERYAEMLAQGVLMLLVGAVMQLVLATVVKGFYDPAAALAPGGALALWGEVAQAYTFALYLFLDFAGYSLMARGLSLAFGVHVPANFRAPYLALDVKDFWNRWHITLSTWLRDFVFMRLVRAWTRGHVFRNRLERACAAYLVNMLVMGAWHGLTPEYLAYGLYHGVLLSATEVYQKRCPFHKRHKGKTWYRIFSWFLTLQFVIFGFALFSGQVTVILKGCLS